jgi:hypothetical protein
MFNENDTDDVVETNAKMLLIITIISMIIGMAFFAVIAWVFIQNF